MRGAFVVVVIVEVVGSGVDVTMIVDGVVVGVAESWTLNVASTEKLAVAEKPAPTDGFVESPGGGSGGTFAVVSGAVESAGGWVVSVAVPEPMTSPGTDTSVAEPAGLEADTEVRARMVVRSKARAVSRPGLSARTGGLGSGPARKVIPIAVTITAITTPGTCRRKRSAGLSLSPVCIALPLSRSRIAERHCADSAITRRVTVDRGEEEFRASRRGPRLATVAGEFSAARPRG